jgi:hypothetical protein
MLLPDYILFFFAIVSSVTRVSLDVLWDPLSFFSITITLFLKKNGTEYMKGKGPIKDHPRVQFHTRLWFEKLTKGVPCFFSDIFCLRRCSWCGKEPYNLHHYSNANSQNIEFLSTLYICYLLWVKNHMHNFNGRCFKNGDTPKYLQIKYMITF